MVVCSLYNSSLHSSHLVSLALEAAPSRWVMGGNGPGNRLLAAGCSEPKVPGRWLQAWTVVVGPIRVRGNLVAILGWLLAELQPWSWNSLFPPPPGKEIVRGVRGLVKKSAKEP